MQWNRAGVATVLLLASCARKVPEGDAFSARIRGLAFLEQDQLKEAEAEFRTVIALAPEDPSGHANLGLVHLRAGRLRDAEREVQRALARDSALTPAVLSLARIYDLTGRRAAARTLLERRLAPPPADPRILYALSRLADSAAGILQRLVALVPGNLSARLALATEATRAGDAATAAEQLEAIRQLLPAPPLEAQPSLALTLRMLRGGRLDSAAAALGRFRELTEVTPSYQASLQKLAGPADPAVGFPVLTFRPYYEIRERLAQGPDTARPVVRFNDGSSYAGLDSVAAAAPARSLGLAAGDIDGDGAQDLLVLGRQLLHNDASRFVPGPGTGVLPGLLAGSARFADLDNDGHLDLVGLGSGGELLLFRNRASKGGETFQEVTARARLGGVRGREVVCVDLDHDGDLDLVVLGEVGLRVFRNNLDGSFREITLEAGDLPYRSVAFADFTGDGLVDLVVTGPQAGTRLFRNLRELRFEDATARSGLGAAPGALAMAAGDYDNDGLLDIVMLGPDSRPSRFRGQPGGMFLPDARPAPGLDALAGQALQQVEFLDYDNDGLQDLVLAGPSRLVLLRNGGAGAFEDRTALLGESAGRGGVVVVSDLDRDGDVDLLVQAPLRLLRNDGGNANQYLRVELRALGAGSGKNNAFGIGARLELRAGELFQTRVVTTPVTLFGLGRHLKADVVRVTWPNGVPQAIYFPGTDQNVLEEQVLKSSCLFLYAWDGTAHRFVTDVMWRSALGMPVGIGGGGRAAYAPAAASEEYLRIAGAQLRPKDGRYTLQLTEELWETSYLDQVRLVAVDHPDSVEVFVDERFVPPAPTTLQLVQAVRPRPPVSATDGEGTDLLPMLRARDDVYTGPVAPAAFQGVTATHDLVLDLGPGSPADRAFLFLRGWVFPTDASINVSLSQSSVPQVISPSLEVRSARGRWRTVIPSLGFPSGKDKTLAVDLAGKLLPGEREVRIRTNMDLHWDQAFIAGSAPRSPVQVSPLEPVGADLHFRGFSRMYRKGGRAGPHWFDYDSVTTTSPWLPIQGLLTRFGDVLPLLTAPDDRTVVMGPGDEVTVQFEAAALPPLPAGWRRDFLIYTVGWIKDGDFNTAHGGTVTPLPYHGLRQYPYAPGDRYPADSRHRRYREEWNTREGAGPPR